MASMDENKSSADDAEFQHGDGHRLFGNKSIGGCIQERARATA